MLDRTLRLLATRGGLLLLIANLLTAIVCAFLPLANHLGFEFALVLTIVSALFAPGVGIAAIREERLRRNGNAAVSAAIFSAGALIIPAGVILLNAVRVPACDPLMGLMWLIVLPIPTAILAASAGSLSCVILRRGTPVWLSVAVVEFISIASGLWTLYFGPAFFLFDHFFGYFPGPLYDELIPFSTTLILFRVTTLLWAAVALLVCAGRSAGAVTLAIALIAGSIGYGSRLGFRTTDASLAEALGGVRTVDNVEVHFPREWNDKTVESFLREVEFRSSQVIDSLKIESPPIVRVWVYRSAEEKQHLVGAGATSFSKPWRHEVHVNTAPFPHPVLRHELVHAYGAEIAHGPFGTPGGWFPNSPLTEGFAVAMDVDDDGLTLAQWAKAMRDLNVAPNVGALFSTASFYAEAPSRVYQYAGAFLRFIDEKYGRAKLFEVYRTGSLTPVGKPLEIAAAFEASLDKITITPAERATAERRLSRPSVFRRRCPHEVGHIGEQAQALDAKGENEAALSAFESACTLEPDDPGLLLPVLKEAIRMKSKEARQSAIDRIRAHPKADASLKATALIDMGNDAWDRNELAEAAGYFDDAAALSADPASHRLATVSARAMKNADLGALLKPTLVDGNTGPKVLFAMSDYIAAHRDDRLVRYLLGRQLVQQGALDRGVALLDRGVDDQEIAAEEMRVLIRGASESGACGYAGWAIARFDGTAANDSDRTVADDWIDRCRFAEKRGWKADH